MTVEAVVISKRVEALEALEAAGWRLAHYCRRLEDCLNGELLSTAESKQWVIVLDEEVTRDAGLLTAVAQIAQSGCQQVIWLDSEGSRWPAIEGASEQLGVAAVVPADAGIDVWQTYLTQVEQVTTRQNGRDRSSPPLPPRQGSPLDQIMSGSPSSDRSRASGNRVDLRGIVPVVSPKGGVGKTFVAVNTAVLVQRHQTAGRTLLLDLDLTGADSLTHLDLLGAATLLDLLPFLDDLADERLLESVADHDSGLKVLAAPERSDLASLLEPGHLQQVFQASSRNFDTVIVDTPPSNQHPVVTTALAYARQVMLVTTLDAASLRQCRIFLKQLEQRETGVLDRVHLVVNQVHDRAIVSPAEVESFLELPVAVTIPAARRAVESSIFNGRPLALNHHALIEQLEEWLAGPGNRHAREQGAIYRLRRQIAEWLNPMKVEGGH